MLKQLAFDCPGVLMELVRSMAQKKLLEDRIVIDASPEEIWPFLVEPAYIPLWQKEVQEVLLLECPFGEELDSFGYYRALLEKDGVVHEQFISDCQPYRSLEYNTVEGLEFDGFAVQLHIGVIRLVPGEAGTEVVWQNYIEYQETFNSAFWMARLRRRFRRGLAFLKWCLENIKAEPDPLESVSLSS